ncbi:MAG: extracellular solute-binding protein [Clostridiales bacterium]|nr:extracellular solute-binding protein [Clostridiales bacterium]
MKRKITSALLVAAMLLAFGTVNSMPAKAVAEETKAQFTDVTNADWFFEAVSFATEHGLMDGTGGGKFSPGATMSRAMLVTVLYRLDGEPAVVSSNSFLDVRYDQWYTNAITWASNSGIVNGYDSGAFGHSDPVTREQAVSILYRYAKIKGLNSSSSANLSEYADVNDVSNWALDAMRWAVAAGIVQGRSAQAIAPQGTSTRAEVAMIFKRFIEGVSVESLDVDDVRPLAGSKITVILPEHEMDYKGLHVKKTLQFMQETGINVELINKGWEAAADDIIGDLAAGGGSYDVIELDNAWLSKFVHNKWVYPLNEFLTPEIKNGIIPGLLDKFKADGNYYGIPWVNDTRFFMYNAKMLKDAGVTNVPRTWAEVSATAKALKEKGVSDYAYIDTYRKEQMGCNEVLFVIYSFGGELVDGKGNPVANTNAGVKEAYEYLAQAYKDRVFSSDALAMDYEDVADAFLESQFPLFLQAWPGVYLDAEYYGGSKIVGDVAVADMPVSKTGAEQTCLALPEAMAITTTSKNKEAAWEYIKYMSSMEFDKERVIEIGSLPVWAALFDDSDVLAVFPHFKQFGKQSKSVKGYPDIFWLEDFAYITARVSQKIIVGSTSVAAGLDEMQKLMEEAKAKADSYALNH